MGEHTHFITLDGKTKKEWIKSEHIISYLTFQDSLWISTLLIAMVTMDAASSSSSLLHWYLWSTASVKYVTTDSTFMEQLIYRIAQEL